MAWLTGLKNPTAVEGETIEDTAREDASREDIPQGQYHGDQATTHQGSQFPQEASSERHNAPVEETCQSSTYKYKTDRTEDSHQDKASYKKKLDELKNLFSLPPVTKEFLDCLNKILEKKDPKHFNPYVFLLYLLEDESKKIWGKSSMPYVVLTHLKLQDEAPFCMSKLPESMKDRVMMAVTRHKPCLLNICIEVFKLNREDLKRHVNSLLESERYKDAAVIASKQKLLSCFQPEKILLPLVVLNKLRLTESCITDGDQQGAFVSMLNKLCAMTDEDLESLARKAVPVKHQHCKMTQASLTKLGERLVKTFRLDRGKFPNLFKTNALKDLPPKPLSIKGAKKGNIENAIHEAVDDFNQMNEGSSDERVNEYSERQRTTYLGLEIPMERIYFVADHESLRRCQRAVSKPGVTVGFDAEWKPHQAGVAQRLSILQLSLRDQAFILDMIALRDKVAESSLLAFWNAVFANEEILKLGYGVESDFKHLVTTLPFLEESIKKMKRCVDLCTFSQQLFEIPVMKVKIEKKTQSLKSPGYLSEKGLSSLVQRCLGLPLDKTCQLSDWEQRPLLDKQIIYAALDAHCLIAVFDVLKEWMAEEKIELDLNNFFPRLTWLFPKRSRKSKGRDGRQPEPGSKNFDLSLLNQPAAKGPPTSPQNFRVVVDNMLQSLGRHLRCFGVDVVILTNGDDHDKAAQIAKTGERVILTTGTPYYTLRSQVPLGKCMCVPAGNAKEQVLAVFKHFNVSVKTSDIFSRCQVCNGNEYVQVSSILMRQAYINYYENEESENGAKPLSLPKTEAPSSPLNVDTLELQTGVKLQIAGLPESILDKVGLFYCCATCGKIFWEGGHFSRICTQFSEVLNDTQSFYDTKHGNVAPPERVTR